MTKFVTTRKSAGTFLVLAVAVIAAFMFTSMTASAKSNVVQDPKGDALSATESANQVGAGVPADTARAYLDIKSVKVTEKKGTGEYLFSMTVGAPVPQDMSGEVCYTRTGDPFDTTTVLTDAAGCFFAWNWDLNDAPSAATGTGLIAPTVRWINGEFQGVAFSPTGPPIFFDTFKVSGSKITATMNAADIEAKVDVLDGFYFQGVTRNHRIDFRGDPIVGVADFTDEGS
jgi:hypothetical protein